jgi:competence protein ComEC
LLGYRNNLSYNIRYNFINTGTYHIFAISGQHISIISLFIIFIICVCGVPRPKWFFFLAPPLIFFTITTGMRASAVRGCIMVLAFFLGPLLGRRTDIQSSLALAALIILAVSPFQLFDYGFILSFSVVAGLVSIAPQMVKMVKPLFSADPWRLQPERRIIYFSRKLIGCIIVWFVFSVSAWFVSTPLIAYWFHLVSLVAVLACVSVIPLVTLILLTSCLSVLFSFFAPAVSEIFNFANTVFVPILLYLVKSLDNIQYSHIFVDSFPFVLIILWFLLLFVFLRGYKLVGTGLLILFIGIIVGLGIEGNSRTKVDVLNIDGSAVCFVNSPGNRDILINCGDNYNSWKLIRYLRSQGVDSLYAVVLASADAKHIGGALSVLQKIPVKEIRCSSEDMRSDTFRKVIKLARKKDITVRCLTKGAQGKLSKQVNWEIIHPAFKEKYASADDAAMAIRVYSDEGSFIFMNNLPSEHHDAVKQNISLISKSVTVEEADTEAVDKRSIMPYKQKPFLRIICTPFDVNERRLPECLQIIPETGIEFNLDYENYRLFAVTP